MSNSGRLRSWIGKVPWGSVRGVGDSGILAMVILRSDTPEDEDGFEIVGHPITLNLCPRVILVNMEISVILGHEKTKIRNIIDYGKIDVFSVRTIIHIKNKMMGHLI